MHYYSRPLPFDSSRWQNGDPVVRYRMKDDLRARYAAGELATRETVDAALGPDDEPGETPQDRYFRLRSPAIQNPWYVRVRFDENGNGVRFLVAPD